MDRSRFIISKVENRQNYEGLRSLWSKSFADEEEFVDRFYRSFGANPDFPTNRSAMTRDSINFANISEGFSSNKSPKIAGYVVLENCKVVAALTCFCCGTYIDKPVYVSYAVCTEQEYRGMGLASELVAYVRDIVIEAGGISLVSPASESLIGFYEKHNYAPYFIANYEKTFANCELPLINLDDDEFGCEIVNIFGEPDIALDEDEIYEPELSVVACDSDLYNLYREAFLAEISHVKLVGGLLELMDGLYVINGGDAICAVSEVDAADGAPRPKKLQVAELIVNPMLLDISLEIEGEIASRLASHWECDLVEYRTPGYGTYKMCQGMVAGLDSTLVEEEDCNLAASPYFGFPLD